MFVNILNKIKKMKDSSLKFYKLNLFSFVSSIWLEDFVKNQMYVLKEFLKKLQVLVIKINIMWFNIDFFFRMFVGFGKLVIAITLIFIFCL